MKKITYDMISEKFQDGGVSISPDIDSNISSIDKDAIIKLFEKNGVILLRGYDFSPENILNFTNQYTEKYSRDANRRKNRFNKKNIRDVDLGTDAHTLHSEGSYSPVSPEIIWFYCNVAPKKGGETILCDGMKLWNKLSVSTKAFFLAEPLLFNIEIETGAIRKGKGKQSWISNTPGTSGNINWDKGILEFTQLQYAVRKTRFGNSLAFSNHLLAELGKDNQIKNKKMMTSSGKEISESIMNEIKEKSELITYDHQWKAKDLIMVDNIRFMHGRRSFKKDIKRDIVIVQSERAGFAYGATTRSKIEAQI